MCVLSVLTSTMVGLIGVVVKGALKEASRIVGQPVVAKKSPVRLIENVEILDIAPNVNVENLELFLVGVREKLASTNLRSGGASASGDYNSMLFSFDSSPFGGLAVRIVWEKCI